MSRYWLFFISTAREGTTTILFSSFSSDGVSDGSFDSERSSEDSTSSAVVMPAIGVSSVTGTVFFSGTVSCFLSSTGTGFFSGTGTVVGSETTATFSFSVDAC